MNSRRSRFGRVTLFLVVLSASLFLVPMCQASPGLYVVARGDTLTGIASRYGLSVRELAQANGLSGNAWVYVGQRLTLPEPQPQAGTRYVVRRGDTLYGIARHLGTTVQAIMAANNLRSSMIRVGQRLVVPTADSDGASPTGWREYANSEYGFSFQYPATWSMVEEEHLIRLERGSWLFAIAYWRPDQDVAPAWSGLPAGEMISRGMMMCMGQEIDRSALVYQDRTKVLTYGAEAGGLVFAMRLEDVSTMDYEAIRIAAPMQAEADRMVGSFRMTSAGQTPAPPAVERIRFAPGATQGRVEGHLAADGSKAYAMWVAGGQFVEIDATVLGTAGQGMQFAIVGADGTVVKPMGDAHSRTVVPSSQDYHVILTSDVGAVDYAMSVLIPVRVQFAAGAISAQVEGHLAANASRHYVLRARAGQRMLIAPLSTTGTIGLTIAGADGQVLLSGRVGQPGGVYDGVLPTSQDYVVCVSALGGSASDYVYGITIFP